MKYLLFVLIFFTLGCSAIVGINSPKRADLSNIKKLESDYQVQNSFICEKPYFDQIKTLKDSSLKQRHAQPLQALYYNNKGQNVVTIVNCNVPGGINLNWNFDNILSVFPPNFTEYKDSVTLPFILNACNIDPKSIAYQDYDYTVLLFWNQYMGRQTKHFLKEFEDNISKRKASKVLKIYINNDNLFVE